MYKILLDLVAGPTLAGLLLTLPLMAKLASAAEVNRTATHAIAASTPNSISCSLLKTQPEQSSFRLSNQTLIASAAVEIPVEYPGTDFSAAESDAAVALFSCDCPSCIGALQQLRKQSLLNSGKGHCLSALQERSQQEVQEVLNTLEAEEASQKPQAED